ncbi:Thylakoid lumenal 19 kDa protein [Zostera marina]|uniref:Thylakoid lumenal 19 kDa protein n=1 Tax=Zostera marina TaxID=29655 RepID=A0A0K9NU49_ZOSMR|nr:Thylakoid lumenal 19 kDa protein [Zostera marina]
MATIWSSPAVAALASASSASASTALAALNLKVVLPKKVNSPTLTLTAAAAAILLFATPLPTHAVPNQTFHEYYGTASSAANYGGFGDNFNKKTAAEYTYLVPDGWKEKLVSKIEKGTNGTDSEFYNPKKKSEKVYLTFLSGFRSLAPMNTVLGNLALSDVGLQDLIANADNVVEKEIRKGDDGQVYYVYEIIGGGGSGHSLITVTCVNNKVYSHFVNAQKVEWERDEDDLRKIHHSFQTFTNRNP